MLRAIGVSFSREGRPVLVDLSLQVGAGDVVVIEGGRGAGKSTLLEIAAALRRPDGGELWIADRDVTGLQRGSLPYVRRNVGYAGGDVGLILDASATENVMLALAARGHRPVTARALAARALGRLGLDGLADRRVGTLSVAERRLVALSRALAGSPPLLVVDDPSAALAPSDVEAVLSVLFAVSAAGTSVLCASADAGFAGAAARAGARRVRLERGRLVTGAVATVLPPSVRAAPAVAPIAPIAPEGPASALAPGETSPVLPAAPVRVEAPR